jgi:hypothetical protein
MKREQRESRVHERYLRHHKKVPQRLVSLVVGSASSWAAIIRAIDHAPVGQRTMWPSFPG